MISASPSNTTFMPGNAKEALRSLDTWTRYFFSWKVRSCSQDRPVEWNRFTTCSFWGDQLMSAASMQITDYIQCL
jgi:hypothetical protein